VICCQNIDASKAKVVWIPSTSQAQENQGMKIERHEIEMQIPERKTGDDTLHVYFFPDSKIQLSWASTMQSPLLFQTSSLADPVPNAEGSR